jgi:predicted nucleic acid-binding Zn ribbon protein
LLAVVLLAFARETLDEGALKSQSGPVLYIAFVVALFWVAGSLMLLLIEKVFGRPQRSRCVVCRKSIFKGEIYCREHLRAVIHEDDDRAHMPQ